MSVDKCRSKNRDTKWAKIVYWLIDFCHVAPLWFHLYIRWRHVHSIISDNQLAHGAQVVDQDGGKGITEGNNCTRNKKGTKKVLKYNDLLTKS